MIIRERGSTKDTNTKQRDEIRQDFQCPLLLLGTLDSGPSLSLFSSHHNYVATSVNVQIILN